MIVKRVRAKNFRGLTSINLSTDKLVNVIVGPNAVGKSTLLEAIRLSKTVLAPRINGEQQQALISVGAMSPHQQTIGGPSIDIASLANNPDIPVEIGFDVDLSPGEIDTLRNDLGSLALLKMQSDLAGTGLESPLAFTQFLSSENGQVALQAATAKTLALVSSLIPNQSLNINLVLDPQKKTISGTNADHQSVLTILDRRLPNQKTLFSLFPADRNFPVGEQGIQLGSGDAQNQLLSHMAQPSLKYGRLKQVIIQNIMLGPNGPQYISDEFNLIFDHLLPGKKLSGIVINELGLVKILVLDEKRGKVFDIDQMSSGEKGLVLTFLFIRLNMQTGGVVLLDEPELHLNSAVQTKILPFLIEHCVKPLNLQAFVCTHSPEIVRDAFEDDDCRLFHLRSGSDLTPILRQDLEPLFEVFGRLGSSAADVLFNRGNVYVEGEHDAIILQAGYSQILAGYKLASLGGRGDIERDVPLLQAEEKSGRLTKLQFFILDKDRKATALKSTDLVRVHQLNRYCIENYLLDENILFDLISKHSVGEVESRGMFPGILEEMALSQTKEVAIKEAYALVTPENPGLRNADLKDKPVDETAQLLAERLNLIRSQLSDFDKSVWIANFLASFQHKEAALKLEWRNSWKEKCSGKKLIDDLYVKYEINMKKTEFKKEVMKRMSENKSSDWETLGGTLSKTLQAT